MKEALKSVILGGGTVSFSRKKRDNDHIVQVSLGQYIGGFGRDDMNRGKFFLNDEYEGIDFFDDLDVAVNELGRRVYTKKNLALALQGISRHKLSDVEFDDMTAKHRKELYRRYFDEYFDNDYPFVSEFSG